MITAVGNVIVIGSIKGSVEAGCMGNDNAYIFALDFKPTDVRISKTHCNFDEFDTPNTENPKKAYLINNQICVDDFWGRINKKRKKCDIITQKRVLGNFTTHKFILKG